jgi:hypothetical protein
MVNSHWNADMPRAGRLLPVSVEITQVREAHVDSFHAALDAVARERKYEGRRGRAVLVDGVCYDDILMALLLDAPP